VALVVLDAAIIIGFLAPEDPLHDACVAALTNHQRDELVIPASVYAEILVGPYRAAAVSEVEAFLSDFGIRIEPVSASVGRIGARLRAERKGLRLPDAFVLASADEIGADAVLTGDKSWAKLSERVTIVGER
jgi:predicted nucleic acid-binding protein